METENSGMRKELVKKSRFLSLVLRHEPEAAGVVLDEQGWTDVEGLLQGAAARGMVLTWEELQEIVETNEKRRFALSADRRRIRASQGHSVEVDLGYEPAEPPEILHHGTATRFEEAIRREGLLKGGRHHVHLSRDRATAIQVGRRHGRPLVFEVLAGEMHRRGFAFFRSSNDVWLTDHVPPEFLRTIPTE